MDAETLERLLRREWWVNHGVACMPYGDDGEMQCCSHDFRREPLDTLKVFVDESRMSRLATAFHAYRQGGQVKQGEAK